MMEIVRMITAIPGNEPIINQIFPNVWVFVSHVLATVLLLILLVKLAWKPTKKYIEKRTLEIQKELLETQKSRIEVDKNIEMSKMKLLESKEVASKILEDAEFEAEEKRKKIESAAINKANHIESETLSQIRKQEDEMIKRVNLEASKLALEAAEVFLSKKVDDEENKKIVDKIIEDLTNSELGK